MDASEKACKLGYLLSCPSPPLLTLFFPISGGFLFAWGDNKNGQLGIGHSNSVHYVPEHVSSLVGVPFSQISAGGYHSFALTLSGALFSWGRNK